MLLVHWSCAVQVAPLVCLGIQLPPELQYAVDAQSVSAAHVAGQAPLLQRYSPHDCGVLVQLPLPSHEYPLTPPLPLHERAPHAVPAFASGLQPPVPLQVPSGPQGSPEIVGQLSWWGLVYLAAGLHVPLVPGLTWRVAAHATQVVLHALLQQKPSTQLPVAHSRHVPPLLQSAGSLHAVPCVSQGLQMPPAAQKAPAAQSMSPVQLVAQVVWAPSQAYVTQAGLPG
jgi:hypothetical protein